MVVYRLLGTYNSDVRDRVWVMVLMPLSTIFQLFCAGQFYWCGWFLLSSTVTFLHILLGPSRSYDRLIYNHLCNQYMLPLKFKSRSDMVVRWDISDNVCLDLQNCCYSIYLPVLFNFTRSTSICWQQLAL
jgi:hypothetical protein